MNLVEIKQDKKHGLVVSSRVIAEKLNKRHTEVLRGIDGILENANLRYAIIPTFYKVNNQKRKYKEYLLTKDGFTLYMFNIQGYNDFKMAYINEFNRMEKALNNKTKKPLPKQQELILSDRLMYNGKIVVTVRILTDIFNLSLSTIRLYIHKHKIRPIVLEKQELFSFCKKYNIKANTNLFLLNKEQCLKLAISEDLPTEKIEQYFYTENKKEQIELPDNSTSDVIDVISSLLDCYNVFKNKTIDEIMEIELFLFKHLDTSLEIKKSLLNFFHKIKLKVN